jgi:hypothetical protein
MLRENVSIVHVAGTEKPADMPSRIIERPASRLPSVTIGALVQARFARVSEEKSRKMAQKERGMVRRFVDEEPVEALAEVISRNSYNNQQAVWFAQLLRHILHSWRRGIGSFNPRTLSAPGQLLLCD